MSDCPAALTALLCVPSMLSRPPLYEVLRVVHHPSELGVTVLKLNDLHTRDATSDNDLFAVIIVFVRHDVAAEYI